MSSMRSEPHLTDPSSSPSMVSASTSKVDAASPNADLKGGLIHGSRVSFNPMLEGILIRDLTGDKIAALAALEKLQRSRFDLATIKLLNKNMPLLHIAASGSVECVKHLIAAKADVNEPMASNGRTPIFMAAASRKIEVMELLYGHGANLEAVDSDGHTVVHEAARLGYGEVLQWLASHGVNLNILGACGILPLHLAALHGRIDSLKMFIEQNVDLAQTDSKGWNAAHYAASKGMMEALEFLEQSGLSLKEKNIDGETAEMIAARTEPYAVPKFLEISYMTRSASLITATLPSVASASSGSSRMDGASVGAPVPALQEKKESAVIINLRQAFKLFNVPDFERIVSLTNSSKSIQCCFNDTDKDKAVSSLNGLRAVLKAFNKKGIKGSVTKYTEDPYTESQPAWAYKLTNANQKTIKEIAKEMGIFKEELQALGLVTLKEVTLVFKKQPGGKEAIYYRLEYEARPAAVREAQLLYKHLQIQRAAKVEESEVGCYFLLNEQLHDAVMDLAQQKKAKPHSFDSATSSQTSIVSALQAAAALSPAVTLPMTTGAAAPHTAPVAMMASSATLQPVAVIASTPRTSPYAKAGVSLGPQAEGDNKGPGSREQKKAMSQDHPAAHRSGKKSPAAKPQLFRKAPAVREAQPDTSQPLRSDFIPHMPRAPGGPGWTRGM